MPRHAMPRLDEEPAPEHDGDGEDGPDYHPRPDFIGGDMDVDHHELQKRENVEDRHHEMADDVPDRHLPARIAPADYDLRDRVGGGLRYVETERKQRYKNDVDRKREKQFLVDVEERRQIRPVYIAQQRGRDGDRETQHSDHQYLDDRPSYKSPFLACSGIAVLHQKSPVSAQDVLDPERTSVLDERTRPVGKTDHHRIEHRRNERSADDDLINRFFEIARRSHVEERHHIGELADLGEREPHLDGGFDIDARQKRARSAVDELPAHYDYGQKKYRRPVRPAFRRIHKQADGNEKYGREHVPQRLDQTRKTGADLGAGADDADEERAESERIIKPVGDVGDEKAAPQKRKQKSLVVAAHRDGGKKARDEDKSEKEHRDKEHAETAERFQDLRNIHSRSVGDAGHKRDDADADDVFADGGAEHILHERTRGPAHLVDDLRQKRRRRVAYRRAEEKRGNRPPAETRPAYGKAEAYHYHRIEQGRRHNDVARLLELRR